MSSADASVSQGNGRQQAPWLSIPSRAISVVEHPCIIKNVDKGITSLGGAWKLSKALRAEPVPDPQSEQGEQLPKLISVSLRPDDPFAKRLLGASVKTNNLLLKVTVPRRTGRKRKRGSSGPFVASETAIDPPKTNSPYMNASDVFRSLQDNVDKYTVTPVGVLDEAHRFRNLPDIQYASGRDEIMKNIRDNLLPLRYSQLKDFNVNTTAGANLTKHVGPSAEFIQMPVAYNYKFQQNHFVKYTGDGRQEFNTQRSLALYGCVIIKPDAQSVPTRPKWDLPPEEALTPYLQSLIDNVRAELEQRPIVTRHYLFNKLGWDKRDRLREAVIYCGYFFETGPWREAIITWGLDPRKDASFRQYQTISFLSYKATGTAKRFTVFDENVRKLARMSAEELQMQHLFDGVHVSETGNLFQFCDITDPMIRTILDTKDIRTVCAPTFQGWYHVGTWAKATVILKDKMNRLITGETPDRHLYDRILTWPEIWDDKTMYSTYRDEVWNPEIHKEKLKEHDVMHTVRWAARNPRWAFEKLEKRSAQAHEDKEDQDMAEAVEEEEVPEDATEIPETADDIFNEGEPEPDAHQAAAVAVTVAPQQEYGNDEAEDEDEDGIFDVDDSDSEGPLAIEEPKRNKGPFGGLYT